MFGLRENFAPNNDRAKGLGPHAPNATKQLLRARITAGNPRKVKGFGFGVWGLMEPTPLSSVV